MAYLTFDFAADHGLAPSALGEQPASFSATEWAVVRLSRRDGLATILAPSRIGTVARRLFGVPAANRLADPRLEALRRAAVLCRHGGTLPRDQADALLAHGFRFEQIAALVDQA